MIKEKTYTTETINDAELKCVTCGHGSYFESNYDRSYVMCMYCFREYKGGYDELYRLNGKKAHDL